MSDISALPWMARTLIEPRDPMDIALALGLAVAVAVVVHVYLIWRAANRRYPKRPGDDHPFFRRRG